MGNAENQSKLLNVEESQQEEDDINALLANDGNEPFISICVGVETVGS